MLPVSPPPVEPDFVLSTRSPFALRIFGEWVHLEGVAPGASVDASRASSSMDLLDGGRQEWAAPRAMRSWSLEYQWASALSLRALRMAARYPAGVLLLDRSAAVANMLRPEDCFGDGPTLLADGMPLPRFTAQKTVSTLVRRGVETFVAAWSETAGAIGSVTYPGGTASLVAPGGTVAQRATTSFVPDADGVLTITVAAGTTGLQVTEDFLPEEWIDGQSAPCPVAVSDPSGSLERMNAMAQARGSWGVELREVGS